MFCTLKIYIYIYIYIYQTYVSKDNSKSGKEVILLLIPNGE